MEDLLEAGLGLSRVSDGQNPKLETRRCPLGDFI